MTDVPRETRALLAELGQEIGDGIRHRVEGAGQPGHRVAAGHPEPKSMVWRPPTMPMVDEHPPSEETWNRT